MLGSYGVGPQAAGLRIMLVPLPYMCGNFLCSALVVRHGECRLLLLGQMLGLSGIIVMIALAVTGLHIPLAFPMPLMLPGFGHGLLMLGLSSLAAAAQLMLRRHAVRASA